MLFKFNIVVAPTKITSHIWATFMNRKDLEELGTHKVYKQLRKFFQAAATKITATTGEHRDTERAFNAQRVVNIRQDVE